MSINLTFQLEPRDWRPEAHQAAFTWWQEYLAEFGEENYPEDDATATVYFADREHLCSHLQQHGEHDRTSGPICYHCWHHVQWGMPVWMQHQDGLTEAMYHAPDHEYAWHGYLSSEAMYGDDDPPTTAGTRTETWHPADAGHITGSRTGITEGP
jgi:hypothetical protein